MSNAIQFDIKNNLVLYFDYMKQLLVLSLTICISWGISCYAEGIYKFVDDNGVTHFTNMPNGKNSYKKISPEKRDYTSKPRAGDADSTNRSHYDRIVSSKSLKYNIEPSLISAVIKVESNWNSRAVSQKGAQGLMQLMPATAREMNVSNSFNPEENIDGGTKYLRYLLDRFNGDLELALAAYNAGPERIRKYGGIPPIRETQLYVKQVLQLYNNEGNSGKKSIYKVSFNDGSILYTNTPLNYDKAKLSTF